MSEQVETVTVAVAEEPVKQNGTAVIEVTETIEEKAGSSGTQEDEALTDEAKSNEEVSATETVTVAETVLEIAESAAVENDDTEPTYSQVVKITTQVSQKSEEIKLDDYSVISMKEEANQQVPPYTRKPENLNWEIQKTICFWLFLFLFFIWLGSYYAYSQGLITIFDEKK